MDKEELKEQVKLLFEIMSDPIVIKSIVGMTWDLYSELQKKGFTKEEALKLTIALAQQKGK